MAGGGTDAIFCEVCRLPHRPHAGICEACGHVLGRAPDWQAIRRQRSLHRRNVFVGLIAVLGMLALNEIAFGGAGYILYMPPVLWLVVNGVRYQVLSKRLRENTDP